MAMTTTREFGNLLSQTELNTESDFASALTVSTMIKTMLEIINIKKSDNMDVETKKQFPVIAHEIILLAEQTK
ncbi:MAG TPA: hypothetical protein VEJ68_00755 [Candidatus Bathyarchaeia archaeon]|nr:hypothetical protein [Candidatus Bathyarchaeia archaeon]